MQITKLDHVNVYTANLDKMVAWYARVLGLKSGKRPDFPFPGAWIYVEEQAAIHLVGVDQPRAGVEPKIEHFAFSATGFVEMVANLEEQGIVYSVDPVPGFPIVQINLLDCDGNHIHIDFDAVELPAP